MRVRYHVLEEVDPSAKALGYYAPAWRCRAVLCGVGRSFDGRFRKSKGLAEHDAARAAVEGLAARPLSSNAKRKARRKK